MFRDCSSASRRQAQVRACPTWRLAYIMKLYDSLNCYFGIKTRKDANLAVRQQGASVWLHA
eukprot:6194464-Pleurochrysis_carterae.AAC.3